MVRFIIAAVVTGILFGAMDGFINGNALAAKLMECYKPIAKSTINIPAGILIDLLYGFAITAVFIAVKPVLPSESMIIKGLVFGAGIWFFRVLMNVVSSWMMFNIPLKTLVYLLFAGLAEMLVLGILNGLIIKK